MRLKTFLDGCNEGELMDAMKVISYQWDFLHLNGFSWKKRSSQVDNYQSNKVESVVTSATEGERGDVLIPFCLFVCLFVYSISQKFADRSGEILWTTRIDGRIRIELWTDQDRTT